MEAGLTWETSPSISLGTRCDPARNQDRKDALAQDKRAAAANGGDADLPDPALDDGLCGEHPLPDGRQLHVYSSAATVSCWMLTLAEQIFAPVLAALNSRQTIIVPNTEDVRAIFYGVARRPGSVEPVGGRPLAQPLLRALVAMRGAGLVPACV